MKNSRSLVNGLTLIEVLIALAIIAIALTAIIKATTENIRSTSYIQNKTIAIWVATYILNEARVGVIKLPATEDVSRERINMLNQNWYWQGNEVDTPNKRIKKVKVSVFKTEDNEKESPLVTVESYVYHEEVQ